MKNLKFNLALIAFVCLIFTSCSSDDDGIYYNNEIDTTVIEYSVIELEILELVNDYRLSKGLGSLEKMNIISSVAESHTEYMAEIGKICHDNFPERSQKLMSNANAKTVGENVGYGYGTAQGVVEAWIKSDGHRAVLENPDYTHFGVSTEQNIEGRNYFTQIFIER